MEVCITNFGGRIVSVMAPDKDGGMRDVVLDGTVKGKHGLTYNFRTAVCLETQKYHDTPNKKDWPSAELRPGETYFSRCIYRFSVAE